MMMKSKDPLKKDEDSKKFTDVKLFAEKFNAYIDSLIEAKKLDPAAEKKLKSHIKERFVKENLNFGAVSSLAMMMNPSSLFKDVTEKGLRILLPLGMIDRLKNAATSPAPAPVAEAPVTTAGFKEWFNRF
jgi:hypothetical protein